MELKAIMYHYVRNPETTLYKGIKGIHEEDFIKQLKYLKNNFEMASPESMLAFLDGKYQPNNDLCVLTFDDGLKEHGHFVTDVLHEHQIKGQFFIPTACIEEGYVLPVHKNHFLLASLDFKYYKNEFIKLLSKRYPTISTIVNTDTVAKTYRWDTPEIASFKYLLNYQLQTSIRNEILNEVFKAELGNEQDFAEELYLSWEEIRIMQKKGMHIGGHSHRHNVLAELSNKEQSKEIAQCMNLIKANTLPSKYSSFSYPFGKSNTFNEYTKQCLKPHNVSWAFSSEIGCSDLNTGKFSLKRADPKDIKI